MTGTSSSPHADPSADAFVVAARRHRKEKRTTVALAMLETAIELWPKNPRVRHQLGLALLATGDGGGVAHLLEAARQDPANVEHLADLAEGLAAVGDNAAAWLWFRRTVAQAPAWAELAVRIGQFLARLQLFGDSEGWIRRGLASKHPFGHGYVVLGSVQQLAGRLAEAAGTFLRGAQSDPSHGEAFAALSSALFTAGAPLSHVLQPGRIAADRMPDQRTTVMPIVQYLRDIGEEAESMRRAARIIGQEMEAAAKDEIGAYGIRILEPDDMIERIGEIVVQLDLHVKMKMLGWLPPFVTILLAPRERVCNWPFLDYWRPYVTVVDDPTLIQLLMPLKSRISFNPIYVRMPDGRVISKARAYYAVQEEWLRQGRKPLLALTQSHVERGRADLKRMGVPEGAWFVCLHVRESGYMKEGPASSEAARNADVFAYLPAVEEIIRRGGWVIRLGDASMTPLPPMKQVIDYAVSPFKSEDSDVFLMASCRFMLGTTSGPVVVSEMFGVPVGAADFFPSGGILHMPDDVIIPRPYREKATGRLLHFDEYLKMPLAFTYDSNHFASYGLEAVPSEAEDILDLAIEMLERTEGKWPYDAEDEKLNARWFEMSRSFTLGDLGCRIGRGFLRRHRHLFRNE